MMLKTWVSRSLRYYRVRHVVFAGTVALTSAILCSALLTGDSLQAGLQRGLHARLGRVRSAAFLPEGVFPVSLEQRIPGTRAALLLRGQLLGAEGAVYADNVQIIGVTEDAALQTRPAAGVTDAGQVMAWCNDRGRGLLAGGECAVRFAKPSPYSVEMPLAAVNESRLMRRTFQLTDGNLSSAVDKQFSGNGPLLPADFALRAASVPPVNVFLPLDPLSEVAGVPGKANLLVSSREPADLERVLADTLTPEDAGLTLEIGGQRPEGEADVASDTTRHQTSGIGRLETLIRSRSVFLPQAVPEALAAAGLKTALATFHLADAFEGGVQDAPGGATTNGETRATSDTVRSTPYGFVAALTPEGHCVPEDLKDDEIVINAWLAEELGVTTNASLALRWRRFEAGGRLVPDSRAFRVRAVIPTEISARAKSAMPVFPGLEGVDSCAAWDVGLPMDEEKLKDPANEAYWKEWRETPKAFLTVAAGKACFGTVFGEAMSVRVTADAATVRDALKKLSPAQMGFAVRPVWAQGAKAAVGSTDFKGLFVGMAFVLVAAALLLSALSMSLALEVRGGEVALFRALGWSRAKITCVAVAEWSAPLLAGALVGGGLGAALARALIWSLARFWSGAFAGAGLSFHFSWAVAGEAAGVSVALTLVVLLRTAWRFTRHQPVELWQGVGRDVMFLSAPADERPVALWESLIGGMLAVGALAVMVLSPGNAAAHGAFLGGGFLLLLSLLLFVKAAGAAWGRRFTHSQNSIQRVQTSMLVGLRRAVQAPRRSAPVVILLAVGVFLTIGILSMRTDAAAGCRRPSSGSGGFASIVTSVMPLNREQGLALARRASGAKADDGGAATAGVVPVRIHEGDEAGCLNMNQPVLPQVIGVNARAMARARAFEPEDSGGIWTLLEKRLADGAVPALAADLAMLQYSLKAKADVRDGTVYDYPVSEGRTVRVRIVGVLPVRVGILEGSLIVDEAQFLECFPADTGYRMWLCDYAPYLLREAAEKRFQVSGSRFQVSDSGTPTAVLRLRHPEPGVTVETVVVRLRLVGSIESAYIDMFLVLGGLGVVLGVCGVALVILRSVQERRGELALLNAVGLPRGTVVRLLAAEYGALVLTGLAVGILPAVVAIQPAARALQTDLPWRAMAGIVVGLFGCAALSVFMASLSAVRRFGPEVLKEEV